MVLPGHLAGGFLATHAILTFLPSSFSSQEIIFLYVIGTLSGDGPDIDLLWYSFKHLVLKSQDDDNHREYISHAPLLWICIFSSISLLGYIMNSDMILYTALIILFGSLTHFIFDSIEYGVMWLWPFSKRRFYLKEFNPPNVPGQKGSAKYYYNFITLVYPRMLTSYFEISVTALAVYIAYNHFY